MVLWVRFLCFFFGFLRFRPFLSHRHGTVIHMKTVTEDYAEFADIIEATTFYDEDPIRAAEERLKERQAKIDKLRGEQLSWLKLVIRRNGTYRDGYRSLVDWTASRLDIPHSSYRCWQVRCAMWMTLGDAVCVPVIEWIGNNWVKRLAT